MIIRPKYARRQESLDDCNISIAPLPPRLLKGSVLAPSLLAGIITGKYCWHQPLYRQEQMMRTAGIACSRSLMGAKGDFTGILQHDAYQPYLTLTKDRKLQKVGCMAHLRRGFDKALTERPQVAGWFMRQFARLYRIEAGLRRNKADPQERAKRRQKASLPIYQLLKKAVTHLKQNRFIPPSSPLGKALTYALGQLPRMETWINNGHIEIDNNLIENSIRPTKLGAKNWLFFGSADSGEMSATLYTLVENVRRLKHDPFAYFEWLFEKLRLDPEPKQPEELLPAAWSATHPETHTLRSA